MSQIVIWYAVSPSMRLRHLELHKSIEDEQTQYCFISTKQGQIDSWVGVSHKDLRDLHDVIEDELNMHVPPLDIVRETPPIKKFDTSTIEWARSFRFEQCVARMEPNVGGHWGRCERKRLHRDDHALERGSEIITWSTQWTDHTIRGVL